MLSAGATSTSGASRPGAAWRGSAKRTTADAVSWRPHSAVKAIIGSRLRSRILPGQRGEAATAAAVLNRMFRMAKPASIRAA